MSTPTTAAHDWELWSTTARLVVTRPEALEPALALVRETLAEVELAASRFRPDSEVMRLAAGAQDSGATGAADQRVEVSPMLADLLAGALDAAAWTGGAVDPTVGSTLSDLGYDRDIASLDLSGDRPVARVRRVPGWRRVRLEGTTLNLPAGLLLDLGATAKAVAADRCAVRVASTLRCGVLVALGGDIATAGPGPDGGWVVDVQDTPEDPAAQIVLPDGAAVATSSTVRRTWNRGGESVHHVVDPRTSRSADSPWRSVTVVAGSCAVANAASTATIAWGADGAAWLATHDLPARLVGRDRQVHLLGGWPQEAGDAA
ncbi:MAG: FAD:protein FMN transferase [Nocardioidaceae bacterium]